ncbi:MAG: hypothetical protein PHO02_01630 [Candidatus Nanoarchaeia archaeon]|nr:hypothetical protein [Candidatus Nanoarchaeia archaeon]
MQKAYYTKREKTKMKRIQFKELVKKDFEDMCNKVRLKTSSEIEELLFMQTIEGHAHEGDGAFKNRRRFHEVTVEDVVYALGCDTDEIKQDRQDLIDEMKEFTARIMQGEKVNKYTNTEGMPLFGAEFLEGMEIQDPAAVLIGIYLGSKMDRYAGWREEAEKKYNLKIGGGECIGVNRKLARNEKIKLETIAKIPHSEEEIKDMIKRGLLCYDVESTQNIVSSYVRKARGKGTSDDLAVLLAGKLFGFDAAVGLYLTDAVDTWDKYVPFIFKSGQDEQLGEKIEKSAEKIKHKIKGFKLPSDDEVHKFISVIAEANYAKMISSSQRYFLQIDPKSGLCPIESHFEYVKGNTVPEVHIGYFSSKLTNREMYSQFESKYQEVYKP